MVMKQKKKKEKEKEGGTRIPNTETQRKRLQKKFN